MELRTICVGTRMRSTTGRSKLKWVLTVYCVWLNVCLTVQRSCGSYYESLCDKSWSEWLDWIELMYFWSLAYVSCLDTSCTSFTRSTASKPVTLTASASSSATKGHWGSHWTARTPTERWRSNTRLYGTDIKLRGRGARRPTTTTWWTARGARWKGKLDSKSDPSLSSGSVTPSDQSISLSLPSKLLLRLRWFVSRSQMPIILLLIL